METWVCAGFVLISNGDMGVSWVCADQQWRHGWVLGLCGSKLETWVCVGAAMETWVGAGQKMKTLVCVGWLLTSNGDMDV